jgi:hypothetical protein
LRIISCLESQEEVTSLPSKIFIDEDLSQLQVDELKEAKAQGAGAMKENKQL